MKKLRFGMLGAGVMAGFMAQTLCEMEEVETVAIASRDITRAKELAERFHFSKALGSYQELVEDPTLDVIYISTPNSLHFAHAKLALEHGKHVLCEKAFTLNEAEAQALFDLAESQGLFIMEAMWTRFLPFVPKLRALLAEGAIGQPKLMEVSFGVRNPGMERLHKAALGGGALLDTGLYALTFALLFFGEDYQSASSVASLTSEGVDGQHAITLHYPDGKLAVLQASCEASFGNQAVIYGTQGRIECAQFWQTQTILVYPDGPGEVRKINAPFAINGYEYQVRAVVADILAGKRENQVMPWAETLKMMRLYDGFRKEWGLIYPQEK